MTAARSDPCMTRKWNKTPITSIQVLTTPAAQPPSILAICLIGGTVIAVQASTNRLLALELIRYHPRTLLAVPTCCC